MKKPQSAIGDRGKWAEKQVKNLLERYDKFAAFAFMRLPDARAGSLQPTYGDFLAQSEGKMYLIEVKEVDHEFRLPYKNFSADKVARMWKFKLAKASMRMVVYHEPTGLWRFPPFDVFRTREVGSGSWDLRAYPTSENLEIDLGC